MIFVINCGIGNIGSARRALADLGAATAVANVTEEIRDATGLVLPGVGGFAESMNRLREAGFADAIRREVNSRQVPLLGICLGMQLLASFGKEGGRTPGLDLISGEVVHLEEIGCRERTPHVGWNSVFCKSPGNSLLNKITDGVDFYFVHSYTFRPESEAHTIATANYGISFAAAVARDRVWGVQFHPEKSSFSGRQVLRNFLESTRC